jgi:hypothetical protein
MRQVVNLTLPAWATLSDEREHEWTGREGIRGELFRLPLLSPFLVLWHPRLHAEVQERVPDLVGDLNAPDL